MATKIQPISKSKTINFGEKLIENFWRQKSNVSQSHDHRNEIVKILQSTHEGIVCIQTEALTDKSLIKQIFDIAQNLKVRFYILVNEYSQELDLLNETCLIRYEVKNLSSFILVNPNSDKPQGIFFTGQLTEQSIAVSQHISISLATKDTEELFRHFCFQFWEIAKKEVIEKGKKSDVTSKPLDVFHDVNVFGGKDFVYGTLFEFSEKVKRSDLSDRQIIYLNQETQIPNSINSASTKDIGNYVLNSLMPKSEFENQEPIFIDDGVSVSIEYKWENIPFYLPEKATDNSLYDRWKNKQEEIVKALDLILNKIQEAEMKEANLSKAISRFFLGKKNVFSALKNEIDDLKATDFACQTESKLKEKINHINLLNVQVQNEMGEIETEDRKAKLEEEIENLKIQISEQEVALQKKKKELEEKQKDEEQKKFVSKTQSEINDIDKKIKSFKNQIDGKEKEKNKQISQSNSSSLFELIGDKNSKQLNSVKSQLVQMPDLQKYPQLPTIGKLFQLNSQQFLVIQYWEEYEQGMKEVERLKANLCTIKN
jgi:hypothetical protein